MGKTTSTESSEAPAVQPSRTDRLEGFIDESIIHSRISEGTAGRTLAETDELALSSTEDDFAGWNLPRTASFRTPEPDQPQAQPQPQPEVQPQPSPAFLVHPKPVPPKPQSKNTLLSAAKRGLFWWLGLSVALACTIVFLDALGLIRVGELETQAPAAVLTQDSPAALDSAATSPAIAPEAAADTPGTNP